MAATYQAVLHNDRLEWHGEAPCGLEPGAAINVQVTILDEPAAPKMGRRRLMAAAPERIAQSRTLSGADASK